MVKKISVFVVTICLAAAMAVLACSCGGDDHTEHTWDDGVSVAATCGDYGTVTYTCTVCGETKTARGDAATGKHTMSNGVCSVCGYVDMSSMSEDDAISSHGFYFEDKDESGTYTAGDAVYFGSYPQNLVTDETLVSSLNEEAGAVPTGSSVGKWTSYGYYVESVKSDVMFYQDVTVGGKTYRGVYIDSHRPYYTYATSDVAWGNGLSEKAAYWYEFAPIEWKVLDYASGQFFLNSRMVIDSQSFQDSVSYDSSARKYYVDGTETYANDWSASTIRQFLNGSFYGWAFDASEQEKIQTTVLDNSGTGYRDSSDYAVDQIDTEDKVFLLSYDDVTNADYDFPEQVEYGNAAAGTEITDPVQDKRIKTFSEYSLSQGLRTSTATNIAGEQTTWWMLRSYGGSSCGVSGVTKNGSITNSTVTFSYGQEAEEDGVVMYTAMGVSPALNVKFW